jgi:transposase-like protein
MFGYFIRFNDVWRKGHAFIVIDEDASMMTAIAIVFRDTIHRLCMWHIMKNCLRKLMLVF